MQLYHSSLKMLSKWIPSNCAVQLLHRRYFKWTGVISKPHAHLFFEKSLSFQELPPVFSRNGCTSLHTLPSLNGKMKWCQYEAHYCHGNKGKSGTEGNGMKQSQQSLSHVAPWVLREPVQVFEACQFGGLVQEAVLTHHCPARGNSLRMMSAPSPIERKLLFAPAVCARVLQQVVL